MFHCSTFKSEITADDECEDNYEDFDGDEDDEILRAA